MSLYFITPFFFPNNVHSFGDWLVDVETTNQARFNQLGKTEEHGPQLLFILSL